MPWAILTSHFLSVKTCWKNFDTSNVNMPFQLHYMSQQNLLATIYVWKVYIETNSVNTEMRKAFSGKTDFIIRDCHQSSVCSPVCRNMKNRQNNKKKTKKWGNHGKASTQKEDFSESQSSHWKQTLRELHIFDNFIDAFYPIVWKSYRS